MIFLTIPSRSFDSFQRLYCIRHIQSRGWVLFPSISKEIVFISFPIRGVQNNIGEKVCKSFLLEKLLQTSSIFLTTVLLTRFVPMYCIRHIQSRGVLFPSISKEIVFTSFPIRGVRKWYRGEGKRRAEKKDPFPGWEERVGARWIADWVIMLGGDHRAWCGNGWHRLVKGNRPDDSTCIRRDKVVYTRRAYLTIRRSFLILLLLLLFFFFAHCPFLPISQHRSRRRDKGRRGELVREEGGGYER